jgi:hypothetical protein
VKRFCYDKITLKGKNQVVLEVEVDGMSVSDTEVLYVGRKQCHTVEDLEALIKTKEALEWVVKVQGHQIWITHLAYLSIMASLIIESHIGHICLYWLA